MSKCSVQPPPEWISGHPPSGGRSAKDHISVLPLANVGHEYGDGRVIGLAIAVPRAISDEDQAGCWADTFYDSLGLTRTIELKMGALGAWQMELEQRPDDERPLSLKSSTWTGEQSRKAVVNCDPDSA